MQWNSCLEKNSRNHKELFLKLNKWNSFYSRVLSFKSAIYKNKIAFQAKTYGSKVSTKLLILCPTYVAYYCFHGVT